MTNNPAEPKTALQNITLWLWDNDGKPQVTVSTNYGTPNAKRRFASLAGEQCRNQWRAFNQDQPPQLKPYFADVKDKLRSRIQEVPSCNFRVSKLAENTGLKGRKTVPAAILVFETDENWMFILYIGPKRFTGEFDPSGISNKQSSSGCLGMFHWSEDTEDYGDAW